MAFSRKCFLLYLLLLLRASNSFSGDGVVVLVRPIDSPPSHFGKYSKVVETLGIECKCCDGVEEGSGECTSSWTGSCSKLQCLPWKFH